MQFEEFDDKIRQAADHHHPNYDEQAWAKMEKLLDKHLPQEDDKKRRFIFFLLFFLLLGGGAWLLIGKPWKKEERKMADSAVVTTEKGNEKTTNSSPGTKEVGISGDTEKNGVSILPVIPEAALKTSNPVNADQPLLHQKQNNRNTFITTEKKANPGNPVLVINSGKKNNPDEQFLKRGEADNKQLDNVKSNDVLRSTGITPLSQSVIKEEKKDQPATEIGKSDANKQTSKETVPENKTNVSQQPAKKVKTKNKNPNSFFFGFSAGPDLSFVSSDKPGTTKLIIGGGIGFTLHDKVTIRTGFYSGRKVYTASPDSYNPPAAWWAYYPNLQKVEADCKVYEIPLLVSYNFGTRNKNSWFASAGVSSLLMKKETYNYFYKYTAYGPTISKKWTIDNQNKHYFSILTMSGGYQRKIGKHISLIAEPYIKLPLTGVGFGKVKLNSGGILFTVGINPLNKQKSEVKNLR